MKKFKLLSLLAILILVSSFVTLNLVNADVDNKDVTITPEYIVYCEDNANGSGKHYDNYSSITKAKINGEIYNAAQWECVSGCGSIVITVPDYGNVYFYSSDATFKSSTGFPFLPGSYQYYDVNILRSGSPVDWQLGW